MEGLNVTSAFTSAASDVIALFGDILPISLGVFALVWGVKKGIGFFKGTAN